MKIIEVLSIHQTWQWKLPQLLMMFPLKPHQFIGDFPACHGDGCGPGDRRGPGELLQVADAACGGYLVALGLGLGSDYQRPESQSSGIDVVCISMI